MTDGEETMYTKMLVPLDGSETAEKALPYARYLAKKLKLSVELLAAIDIAELAMHITAGKARFVDRMIDEAICSSENYLRRVAATFSDAATVTCKVENGSPEDVIIEQ